MRQPHRVAPGQRPQRFRQLLLVRHRRIADQHGDYPLALVQRRGDLDADEIIGIVEPPCAGRVARVDPTLADDGEHDIALGDAFVEHAHEVEARRDIVDVEKELLRLEYVLQPVEQTASSLGIVPPAVVEEDLARHLPKVRR